MPRKAIHGRTKAFGIVVVAELALLALVVTVFLHNEGRTQFPVSVPVASASPEPVRSSVPVSVSLKEIGSLSTAALSARGGAAQPTGMGAVSGLAGSPSVP